MLRALIFSAALFAAPATAEEVPVLTVTGTGEASAAPDIATITVGVETQGATAEAALADNSADAARLIEAAKASGVEPRDIQTSGLSIYPVYDQRSSDRSERPQIIGYAVNNQVSVRLRDMQGLGQTLGDLVKAGANQMRGIAFGIEDDAAISDEARKRAIADARRKAEIYAEAAGVKLGAILSISEGGGGYQPRGPVLRAAAAEAVPVEIGESAISVSVVVVWEIGD
ncbi:MAG: SIMPL domain-containing protein [Pseudomonadota bacterium]